MQMIYEKKESLTTDAVVLIEARVSFFIGSFLDRL